MKNIKENGNVKQFEINSNSFSSADFDSFSIEDKLEILTQIYNEKKELEIQNKALRRSNKDINDDKKKYAELYNSAPIGYLTIDDKGLILDANFTACSMFGMEKKRLLGRLLFRFVRNNNKNKFFGFIDTLFENDRNITCELEMNLNNEDLFIRLDSRKFKDKISGNDYAYITLTDVTQKKVYEGELKEFRTRLEQLVQERTLNLQLEISEHQRTVAALQESKTHHRYQAYLLQEIIDAIPFPIFFKNKELLYIGCNKAFESFTSQCKDKIISYHEIETFPNNTDDIFSKYDSELLSKGGMQVYEAEYRNVDEKNYNIIFYKTPFTDIDGAVGGLVGLITDHTGQKKTLMQLNENKLVLDYIFEHIPSMILNLDVDGKILYFNQNSSTGVNFSDLTFFELFEGIEAKLIKDKFDKLLMSSEMQSFTFSGSALGLINRKFNAVMTPIFTTNIISGAFIIANELKSE
ncbi:MAG: PAS domain-containing protein [Candidatus Kapabacteria bacterium]|nr:PAS domain-containing protein [Candidatus Kapabacteria bacterium]